MKAVYDHIVQGERVLLWGYFGFALVYLMVTSGI